MSARHLLYTLLSTDPGIQAVFATRIIDAGELGETPGTQPPFPYLVTKFRETTPGASRTSRRHLVELWAYDEPRDYTRLEKGLDAAFAVLHERSGGPVVAEGETTWLVEGTWESTSNDLTDDVLRASTRYSTYTLVTNTQ